VFIDAIETRDWLSKAMWRDFFRYAWDGSIDRAGTLCPILGVILVGAILWLMGRTDVVLPTTLPGAIEFFVATYVPTWIFIFVGRLLYAPYRFLRSARAESAARREQNPLEIVFDGWDAQYVRPIRALSSDTGERYWIGIRNNGPQTLDDVALRALDSWFTREAISVAQGQSRSAHPVEINRVAALHPGVQEITECVGLSYESAASSPDYIFNTVQEFTLEATARNVPAVRRVFRYDPKKRPMLEMLTP
jgi:hypothetical protein